MLGEPFASTALGRAQCPHRVLRASGISAALKRCSAGWIDSELNEFLIPAPAVGIKIFAVYLHALDPVESASKLVIRRFGAPVLR